MLQYRQSDIECSDNDSIYCDIKHYDLVPVFYNQRPKAPSSTEQFKKHTRLAKPNTHDCDWSLNWSCEDGWNVQKSWWQSRTWKGRGLTWRPPSPAGFREYSNNAGFCPLVVTLTQSENGGWKWSLIVTVRSTLRRFIQGCRQPREAWKMK